MRRALAATVACSVAGCSLFATRGPLAPDRAGECTTSYRPVRVDTWTGIALIVPLVALGTFMLVDASAEPEEGPPDPVNGQELLVPTAAAFAVGIPFAISAGVGGRRVDGCRRARGMLTGDEELAAQRAAEAQRIAACHAAGPAGAPSMVTFAGPDTEVHACPPSGVVVVRGSGGQPRLLPRCQPFDAHPGCRTFELDDRIIARTAGVTVRKDAGDAGCARPDDAAGEADVIHLAVDDWADVDAVLAVARAELAQWNYGAGVVVRVAVTPACDEPTR